MGLGGISPWSLLLILVIILLLFGTKRLRNVGGDLGNALKSFKNAMRDNGDENKDTPTASTPPSSNDANKPQVNHTSTGHVIDAEAKQKDRA